MAAKPYTYGETIILPHDASAQRLGMESIENQLRVLGWPSRVLKVEPSILPGIEASRVMINKAVFDTEKTKQGRSALNAYRREYDDKRHCFKPGPLHDWASDGADSFRYAVRAITAGFCRAQAPARPDQSHLNRPVI